MPSWFTTACGSRRCARRSIRSSITSRECVTGEVKLRLYKGNIDPARRKSPNSLYSLDIASFTMGASYDQKDALGFINLDRAADEGAGARQGSQAK
jgi:argininosuccinate synthase